MKPKTVLKSWLVFFACGNLIIAVIIFFRFWTTLEVSSRHFFVFNVLEYGIIAFILFVEFLKILTWGHCYSSKNFKIFAIIAALAWIFISLKISLGIVLSHENFSFIYLFSRSIVVVWLLGANIIVSALIFNSKFEKVMA